MRSAFLHRIKWSRADSAPHGPSALRHPTRRAAILATLGAIASLAPALPAQAAPLDPASIPKYQSPLVIPPAMPRTSRIKLSKGKTSVQVDYYEIAVRQFQQQVLPASLPMTTVWSYGSVTTPGTFNYTAFTIEAKTGVPVRIKWMNQLVDASGNYLQHLLPVDQTLHWANPPGGLAGRDHVGTDPTPYTGPVPMVSHVHGAHTSQESDGYPEAWYLPAAKDIPAGYATTGTMYDQFKLTAKDVLGNSLTSLWAPGSAVFEYPNNQRATTLWYHDHSLGLTRLNVYAGPAGFYILRGGTSDLGAGILPGLAPAMGDPAGMLYYEIPIAIQDRSFNTDGSLAYPTSRTQFDGFTGPFIPDPASDISPIWNPEFFGNTIVVNGKTWPFLQVENRRYRFRFLNGCQARFLILQMGDQAGLPLATPMPFWQIGTEGGFLPAPVQQAQLLLGPAERADVVVDFSAMRPGTVLTLLNLGPDEPYGGGIPGVDFASADPNTTGQVMQFKVVKSASRDKTTLPAALVLPPLTPLPAATVTRQISLNEATSNLIVDPDSGEWFGPRQAQLGTVMDAGTSNPMGMPMMWMDAPTETPKVGDTEVWEIYNFTMDAHPIHIHQVMFQVVDREGMPGDMGNGAPVRGPEIWETGYKDTVIAYPGEITRVKARFDIPGLFVWHCHILEHEDNEMMRPYRVLP